MTKENNREDKFYEPAIYLVKPIALIRDRNQGGRVVGTRTLPDFVELYGRQGVLDWIDAFEASLASEND